MERYGLGIVSEGVKKLPAAVKRLLADDGRELARIRECQRHGRGGCADADRERDYQQGKETCADAERSTLLHVKGAVKFVVEGTNNDAAIHTENAAITPAADTLTTVTLSGYEIVKLVQISDTVMTMSIAAFESWIVDMLAEAIARKVEDFFINGTGTSQPKGIDKANTWGATNSVTVGASASLTAANVQTLIGLLNAGYDRNAKFVMSKRTLFTDLCRCRTTARTTL